MTRLFILLIVMMNLSYAQQVSIYLVKQNWHTGLVISLADVDTVVWKEINEFAGYSTVDVGWGDAEFYQHPGFDAWLAVKALFYPTPSALRIEAFNMDPGSYASQAERAHKITLSRQQFDSVCSFISNTYYRNSEGTEKLSIRAGGRVVFYKAQGNYHALNTCNTWIADALKYAGIKIEGSVITTDELFERLKNTEQF